MKRFELKKVSKINSIAEIVLTANDLVDNNAFHALYSWLCDVCKTTDVQLHVETVYDKDHKPESTKLDIKADGYIFVIAYLVDRARIIVKKNNISYVIYERKD